MTVPDCNNLKKKIVQEKFTLVEEYLVKITIAIGGGRTISETVNSCAYILDHNP